MALILKNKLELLNQNRNITIDNEEEKKLLSNIGLLSIKPRIIVCNVDEGSLNKGNSFTESIKSMYPEEKIIERVDRPHPKYQNVQGVARLQPEEKNFERVAELNPK